MTKTNTRTGRRWNREVSPERRSDRINVSLPLWLIEWLRDQEQPQALLVREALIKHYRLSTRGRYIPRYEFKDKKGSE